MARLFALPIMLLALFALTRSAEAPPSRFPQDAYIWQRVWTPYVLSAVSRSADLVAQWRVLAAETDARGTLKPVAVNWAALGASRRPIIAVVRIDGFLAHWDESALLAGIGLLASSWRKLPTPPTGLEIDYDCATSRLTAYAAFLARLHAMPGVPRRLSITALPAWLSSPALERVTAEADEVVLQVHAVRAPQNGLFDPAMARGWIDAFADRTSRPFRVALPDYGARVIEANDGSIFAIESEMPRLAGGDRQLELMAAPADAARLLADLARSPPAHFAGVVWFRLPTENDSLTWSVETWRAVASGQELRADIAALAKPATTPGLTDIVLANRGGVDVLLPAAIGLPEGCDVADGVNGYTLDGSGRKIFLRRLQTALLHAHRERTIGWMRCQMTRGNFDVRP